MVYKTCWREKLMSKFFRSFVVMDHRLKKADEYASLITIVFLRQCHSFVGCDGQTSEA
jgi:hypothetical protein